MHRPRAVLECEISPAGFGLNTWSLLTATILGNFGTPKVGLNLGQWGSGAGPLEVVLAPQHPLHSAYCVP